jgi:flagella basal body P-ring formation protein FlgA
MAAQLLPALALSAAATIAAPPTWINATLLNAVRIPGPRVTLGDLVRMEASSSECAERLKGVTVPSPTGSDAEVFTRPQIEAAVAGIRNCHLRLGGSETVVVSLVGKTVDLDGLRERAQAVLMDALKVRYSAVSVQPVDQVPARDLRVPADSTFEILPPDISLLRQRMVVDVAVRSAGRKAGGIPLWFRVEASAPAWRLDQDLHPGDDLAIASKHCETTMVSDVEGAALPADFDFDGYVGKLTLPAGAVLTRQDVMRRPAVVAGQAVSLRYQSQSIQIEVAATALQSGNLGEQVRVRNDRSKEDLVGEVQGPGIVTVMQ